MARNGSPRRQPIRTGTGQGYGAAKQQADLQREAPLPDQQPTPQPAPEPMPQAPPQQPFTMVDPFAPTDRPDEPITAGIAPPDPREALAALYARFPYEDIRRLLEYAG